MPEKRESRTKRELPREETKQEATVQASVDATEPIVPQEVIEAAAKAETAVELAVKPGYQPREWKPKTQLGRDIVAGKIPDINYLFENGIKITEPGVVDALLPNLQSEIILIGGSTGKGGGIRRTPSKRTTRMHKSGRRYRVSVLVIVGNSGGYVGFGMAHGPPGRHREVVEKAMKKAKLNIVPVRAGCGSWECKCGTGHSIPIAVSGKSGSVVVNLMPAPKGVGLVVMDEVKKVMALAGIKDIWCKSRGQTASRINLIKAIFDAFRKLNAYRISEEEEKALGIKH